MKNYKGLNKHSVVIVDVNELLKWCENNLEKDDFIENSSSLFIYGSKSEFWYIEVSKKELNNIKKGEIHLNFKFNIENETEKNIELVCPNDIIELYSFLVERFGK